MSEFDKHWDEWAIASNCTEDEVKSHFEAGQQSQKGEVDRLQTKIDELQTRIEKLLDYTGTSGHTPNWIIKEFLK